MTRIASTGSKDFGPPPNSPGNRLSRAGRGAALLAALAVAQVPLVADPITVTSFDLFTLQFYTQTSSAPPASPDSYQFNARIFVSSSISGATSSLTAPSTVNYGLGTSGTVFQQSESFPSDAAMDAVYGPGAYNFSLQSNNLSVTSTQTGTLTNPASFYSVSTPYFTNFASMQSLNASQNFALNWNAFATNPSAALSQTFLVIYDHTQSLFVVDQFFPDAVTSTYNLIAGTLIAGHSYTASIYFSSRTAYPGAWSEGANGLVAFDRATSASFTAIPEPAATTLLAGGVLALVALGRRRAALRRRFFCA